MADKVDRATRSRIMARVPSKGSSPEMAVRRALHAKGYRYRLHRKNLPGNPDLVFPRYRIAVFIHGCFWHRHDCEHFRMPSSNVDYWAAKIGRNVERDRRTTAELVSLGWTCRIIWECRLAEGVESLVTELQSAKSGGPSGRP